MTEIFFDFENEKEQNKLIIKRKDNFKIYDENRNLISSFEKTVNEFEDKNVNKNLDKIENSFDSINLIDRNEENENKFKKVVSEPIMNSSSSSNENEIVNKMEKVRKFTSNKMRIF